MTAKISITILQFLICSKSSVSHTSPYWTWFQVGFKPIVTQCPVNGFDNSAINVRTSIIHEAMNFPGKPGNGNKFTVMVITVLSIFHLYNWPLFSGVNTMMILNHHILSQVPDNASCEKCFAYIYDLGFRNYEVLSLADEDCTVQNMHAKHRVITIPISKFKFIFT